jgi:ABC-type uncharacterized transport system involved in gliding motility auxiliary subunit
MANRILNIVGWVGMVLVVAALAVKIGLPAREEYVSYLAWGGLVCLLAYTCSQWREIGKMFSRRQARYGTLLGASIVIVLGILVAINYLGVRQNKRWDLTAARQFSLSDQSRNFLAKLDAPLHVMVFAQDTDFQTFRDRLEEYEYASKQVTTEYVDPDKRREVAQQNQIQQYGTIVFKYRDRTERITTNTEQDITNAVIKIVTGEQKKVYFSQGHGEKNPDAVDRDGYGQMVNALKAENYAIDKVVIAQTGTVPDDATVLVVAGPKVDFLPNEIDVIKKYLDRSGKLLLELDPPEEPNGPPLTNLIALAKEWGIEVGNDLVVDVSGMGRLIGASEAMPVAANYPTHPITERFSIMTVYPLTRSVTAIPNGTNGRTAQPFVETSERSWSETNLKDLYEGTGGDVVLNEGSGDRKGPISIAAAVSAPAAAASAAKPAEGAPTPEARVVVFGDSDFASNASFSNGLGNKDLFMNTIGWLSQQENLISIRPKDAEDRRITLTPAQQNNIMILSLLLIPGFIFGSGVYSWWKRR